MARRPEDPRLHLMPTRFLNDRQIRPTEYIRWAHAVTRFERREKDRRIMENLITTIPKRGLDEPILLCISDRTQVVYVSGFIEQ